MKINFVSVSLFLFVSILGNLAQAVLYSQTSSPYKSPYYNPNNRVGYTNSVAVNRGVIRDGSQAQAVMSTKVIPYYSQFLYQAFKIQTKDNDLKYVLKSILRNFHIAKPGQLDEIVQRCPTRDKSCYSQVNVGYDYARVFLMGYLFLKKDGSQYAIKEVYCDRDYTNKDFKAGNGPAPQRAPDNRVINVEHTWPQSKFTGAHPKEVQKADLHHLFPSDSELNSIRGNKPFGEVQRELNPLKCSSSKFGLGKTTQEIFEPPNSHKGRVARALFYFSVRYDIGIDPEQEAVLRKWNAQFPVDQEEFARNEEIFKVQGNRNPFVDFPDLSLRISDF